MAEDVNPDELDITDELIAERRAEQPGETPETMTPWQRPITAAIDVLNYRAGQIIALLMVPLIAVVVWEVLELPGANTSDACNNVVTSEVYAQEDGISVVAREALQQGEKLDGPAVITEYSATTYVAPGWCAATDQFGNLRLQRVS